MSINLNDIVADLQQSGINRGETVLVHSSLKSIGYVEGGADTVIDAFIEVLGTEGTLLFPSFQKGSEFFLVDRGCRFDVRTSPAEIGKITEVFRQRPGVIRSLNPTHCTAGIGKYAATLLADHDKCPVACGWDSPYHRITEGDGKIVLLGTTHDSNTTLHFVENCYGAPTVCSIEYDPVVIDQYGNEIIVPTYPHMPQLPRRYNQVEPFLVDAGIQTSGRVGKAECKIINARAMVELIGGMIKANPVFLIEPFYPT